MRKKMKNRMYRSFALIITFFFFCTLSVANSKIDDTFLFYFQILLEMCSFHWQIDLCTMLMVLFRVYLERGVGSEKW